ncbi:endonuclease domain-containing protein [Agromyces sp. NPDC057679]|uniref:endonuclease domain-containing protein n=1 Tax=Agromyces sp. NPDC057679 TaxID=3346207 RepID=UPI00366C3C0B
MPTLSRADASAASSSPAVVSTVAAAGGVCSVARIADAGLSRHAVDAAVAAGVVARVRRGWVATPNANPDVVRAVRVGGVATAATVARMHGIRVPDDPTLHVRVARGASRLRAPDPEAAGPRALDRDRDRVCVHHRSDPAPTAVVDPLTLALAEMLNCAAPDAVIAALDSALSSAVLSARELEVVRELGLRSRHWIIDRADAGSESGIETKARMLLRTHRIRHRSQVRIAGVGRVDLLVGDRLVIEVDGSQFHSGDDEFESDRRRDFELAIRGYLVLRLSYRMVTSHWDATSEHLLAVIARGEHRWAYRAQAFEFAARALPQHKRTEF